MLLFVRFPVHAYSSRSKAPCNANGEGLFQWGGRQ